MTRSSCLRLCSPAKEIQLNEAFWTFNSFLTMTSSAFWIKSHYIANRFPPGVWKTVLPAVFDYGGNHRLPTRLNPLHRRQYVYNANWFGVGIDIIENAVKKMDVISSLYVGNHSRVQRLNFTCFIWEQKNDFDVLKLGITVQSSVSGAIVDKEKEFSPEGSLYVRSEAQ